MEKARLANLKAVGGKGTSSGKNGKRFFQRLADGAFDVRCRPGGYSRGGSARCGNR